MLASPIESPVRVWLGDPYALDTGRDLLRFLDPQERAQHDRFHFERDRQLYRTAHALLRALLARYGELPPGAWRFSRSRHGRPAIAPEHPWLRFNLSHTRGLVVVAIARDRDVGVDVEEVVADRATDELAARVLSTDELAALEALSPDARVARFFALWTCKEAYIKGRGLGLSLPLDAITVTFDDQPQLRVDESIDDGRCWSLQHRALEHHHLAVAFEGEAEVTIQRATSDVFRS